MKSSARLLMIVSIGCCVIATSAVQAQDAGRGRDSVLAGPNGPGISMKDGVADLLSAPAVKSLPTGRLLNFPDQFTLGGAQSSITLNNIRTGAVFAGGNSSTDRSCLTARAYMRPDIANKNLHQNWLSAKNSCSHYIKVSVCYRGSASCISISVPPWQTKSAIIGYAPTASVMHYQINLDN